jgi:hypothetical protein
MRRYLLDTGPPQDFIKRRHGVPEFVDEERQQGNRRSGRLACADFSVEVRIGPQAPEGNLPCSSSPFVADFHLR